MIQDYIKKITVKDVPFLPHNLGVKNGKTWGKNGTHPILPHPLVVLPMADKNVIP